MTAREKQARLELVQTAAAIRAGTLDLVVGCRRLCKLQHEVGDADRQIFLPIIAFESDTDRHPVGNLRSQYSQEFLRQLDQELHEYVESARPGVLAACEAIMDSFGGT